MNKKFQILFLVIGLLMAACSDDSDPPKYPVLQTGAMDVTNGYNSIIIDLDSLPNIPLYTDREITLENKNEYIGFDVVKENGQQYIKPYLKKDIAGIEPFTTELKIKIQSYLESRNEGFVESEGKMSKVLYLLFRRKPKAPDSPDVNYARAIGKGTKPWGDMGNVTHPILDFDAIYEHLTKNENLTLKSIFFETSGEKYSRSMEKIGGNLGLSASNQRIGRCFFSGSASYGIDKSTSKSSYYEYYIGYYGKKMSEVRLNQDWLYSQRSLRAVLDATVNNVLNNPGNKAYQRYANDSTGIFQLLENYGTHIITQASFGGNYTVLYGREENAYETSVGHDAGLSIGAKKPMNGSSSWRDIYLNKTASPAVSASAGYSEYSEEQDLASKSFFIVKAQGGNASDDMDAWDKSMTMDTKDSWIPISYLLEGDSEDTSSLLPIYELVVDSARKEAIMKYIDAFYEKHIPQMVESPMIVVDFMMKAEGTNSRKDGTPKPFIKEDPFGQKRWYYPMMANGNAPTERGYALDVSTDDYNTLSVGDNLYWYYALGHQEKDKGVYGITDIRFCVEGDAEGYTKRGDNTDPHYYNFKKKYVHLKFANENTDVKDLVKAIGLQRFGDNDNPDDDKIIASTGGAEMTYPFEIDTRFNNYWKEGSYTVVETPWWASDNFMIETIIYKYCPNNFYPVYSTKNLDVEFNFGDGNTKGKITHPKKWGEEY